MENATKIRPKLKFLTTGSNKFAFYPVFSSIFSIVLAVVPQFRQYLYRLIRPPGIGRESYVSKCAQLQFRQRNPIVDSDFLSSSGFGISRFFNSCVRGFLSSCVPVFFSSLNISPVFFTTTHPPVTMMSLFFFFCSFFIIFCNHRFHRFH